MSDLSCEVSLNTNECEHAPGAEPEEYPAVRSRCVPCGQRVCKTCSRRRQYLGKSRRVCNDCAGFYQQDHPGRPLNNSMRPGAVL